MLLCYLVVRMSMLEQIDSSAVSFSALREKAKGRKVIIVLSSGGLRLICHLPLLHIFELLKIHVDELWGVSAGSIAGGLWASGLKASDIEDAMLSLRKEQIYEYFLFTAFRALIPSMNAEKAGFLTGNKLEKYLGSLVGHADNPLIDLRDLRILAYNRSQNCKAILRVGKKPDTIEITQECSGKTNIEKGTLVDMLRASLATPVMFRPKRLNGQVYIDGGIAENFPVLTAFSHFCDDYHAGRETRGLLLVGVNISYSGEFANQRTNIIKSIAESYDIIGHEFTKLHISMLEQMVINADFDCEVITIDPGVHNLALSDFKRLPVCLDTAIRTTVDLIAAL